MESTTQKNAGKISDFWIKRQRSERTANSYRGILKRFCLSVFEKQPGDVLVSDLKTLTPKLVNERFIEPKKRAGVKQQTIRQNLKVMQSCFKTFAEELVSESIDFEYIEKHVLSDRYLIDDGELTPPLSPTIRRDFISWLLTRQFKRTEFDNTGERYAIIVEIMHLTAIRLSATFSLKWGDIRLEEDSFGNVGYNIYAHDKGSKVNKKAIPDMVFNKLVGIYTKGDSGSYIFNGVNPRTFQNLMNEFLNERGVEVTPHSIKVGAATELYARTHDIVLVQRFLEHYNLKTTEQCIKSKTI